MPHLNLVHGGWNFLQTLHPLFLFAESLPTIEGADQDQYGYVAGDAIEHLKNEITMLRNDFKLNMIKQQQVDIEQLCEDESILDRLQPDLQTLLEALESLIDPRIHDHEYLEVGPPSGLFVSLSVLVDPSISLCKE